MSKADAYICDGCNETVHGMDRGRFKHRDYISIEAKMALQLMDMKTRYAEHIFLTRPPSELLSFCLLPGLPCLEKYIDRRRAAYNFKKQQQLREVAGKEANERLETGGFNIDRRREKDPYYPRPGETT